MVRRQTWLVVAVFVVLAAFTWFFQKYQANKSLKQTATVTATTTRVNLFNFDTSQVSHVVIKSSEGNKIGLTYDQETPKWTIDDVPAEKGDSFQIESILAQLFAIQVQEVLTQTPPLESIGLATPADTITITQKDGSQVVTEVGSVTAIGSGYYVRIGGNQVTIVDKTAMDTVLDMLTNPPLVATPTPETTSTEGFEPITTPTP